MTNRWKRQLRIGASSLLATLSVAAAAQDSLLDGFHDPPHAARPHVWWHWLSGNVTWQGAKLDLEWMHRIGIGGVGAFSGGELEPTVVKQPLPFMSPGWRDVYARSVALTHEQGMDFTIAGAPGWSQTGAPWVKPADGMKKFTWSTTEIAGGGRVLVKLAPPPSVTGAFQDLAGGRSLPAYGGVPSAHGNGPVIAFRTPAADLVEPSPTAARYSTAAGSLATLDHASDDLNAAIKLPLSMPGGAYLDVDFERPVVARALSIAAAPLPAFEILTSDDGISYRSIGRFAPDDEEAPAAQQTVGFAPTRNRHFRIRFDVPVPPPRLPGLPASEGVRAPADTIALRSVRVLTGARVDRFEAKAGFQATADFAAHETMPVADGGAVDPASVVDLTDRVQPDGTLDWNAPAGQWTIVRFGWSLTGRINEPAEPLATGLEVDKLDARAVGDYVETLLANYRDKVGVPLGPDGIGGLLTDSWEAGPQNWTRSLLADFKRLRGYDPTPWLPVLVGRVVGSAAKSDAFLADFRQTLKDLIVSNHYRVLADAAHRNGMIYYTEMQGDTPRAIGDGLTAKAQADVPTGEMWLRPYNAEPGQATLVADLKEAASAAHVYGRPLVGAEAFTVAAGEDPWGFSPAMLKPVADEIFSLGVNRMLLHESHMQPFVDAKPGLELGFYGTYFNRNNTWAEQARPWVDYLARTSYLLQQGRYVADIAYLYGDQKNLTELFHHRRDTDVPQGYGYDYIDAAGLDHEVSVGEDGRLVSAGGTAYRLIYLPATATRLRLSTVRRLLQLVEQGAVLVGRRPAGGLGLDGLGPDFVRAAEKLWGAAGGGDVWSVGKGRVYPGGDLRQALDAENVAPDVLAPVTVDVRTLHRRTADADIYYISNPQPTLQQGWFTFRTTGRAPELWVPEDGSTQPLSYRMSATSTAVPLDLAPQQSLFVIFRHAANAPSRDVPEPRTIAVDPVDAPWSLTFEPGRGAPPSARFDALQDWSRSADPGIRYFSGTATYRQAFFLSTPPAGHQRVVLDLGDVKDLASVSVNGHDVGTAWHAPFKLDITSAVVPGRNELEIRVTNLWVNRLIGDKQPGAEQITYAPQSPYTKDSPLRPSGLLGPVRLLRVDP